MPGRLALDFGTSNTVVALWDADRQDGHTVSLADLTRALRDPQGREYFSTPSLVHYASARLFAGNQVLTGGHKSAPATFRRMKSYVANGMKLPRQINGQEVDNFRAAGDFLRQILLAAGGFASFADEDVAFTVPVEAFEHYQQWLEGVAHSAGVGQPRFLDEASAAALGYAARLRPGAPFLTFDFGGGTLDVAIVRADTPRAGQPACRALGKAGAQIGGTAIDQWLARDAAQRAGHPADRLPALFLDEAERVKESLSAGESETFTATDPATGAVVSHHYSRGAFEDLLEANGLYAKVNAVLDAAESAAREHGYDRDTLQAVLMIGGSSLIPSVRRLVRARYGERVRCERPFDAVAVGAAAWVAGAGFDDRLRHAYALRPYDRAKGRYVYHTIVEAGTAYPCEVMNLQRPDQPLELTIKASQDQQTRLGLQVYEVAQATSLACGGDGFDLVFDQNGSARYRQRQDEAELTHRPIGSPTFIPANPPAALGDPRFLATFAINAQRQLCVTVHDTLTGKVLCRNQPMVKLT